MSWPVVHLSKQDAAEIARAAAFTDEEDGRTTLHSFLGGIGADHDLDSVLKHIEAADEVAWADHLFHHDLAVRLGGRIYRYDVQRPERRAV